MQISHVLPIVGLCFVIGAPVAAEEQGMQYLGAGINIFEFKYGADPKALALVVDPKGLCMPGRPTCLDRSSETITHEIYGDTFSEFKENLATSVGLKGSYGGFSASLDASFDKDTRKSLTTKFLMLRNTVGEKRLALLDEPRILREHLTSYFKTAVGSLTTDKLFEVYGTHVMTEVNIGAEVIKSFNSSSSESVSKECFKLKAKAAYNAGGGSAEATANTSSCKEDTNDVSVGNNKLQVRGGSPSLNQRLFNHPSVDTYAEWAASVGDRSNPGAFLGFRRLVPIWELIDDDSTKKRVRMAFLQRSAKYLNVIVVKETSTLESRPEASVGVPPGYKMLSGGAFIAQPGDGNLLTSSFPSSGGVWQAKGKEHKYKYNSAILTVYALGLHDPYDIWETKRHCITTKDKEAQPSKTLNVPEGYVLVGGGAQVNWNGDGSLLTASYPESDGKRWSAEAKEHIMSDPATIMVCVIGLKSKIGVELSQKIDSSTGSLAQHAKSSAVTDSKYVMVGGGAKVNWTEGGNLLTSSYPSDQLTWTANSKDHGWESPARITTYTIGLSVKEPPDLR